MANPNVPGRDSEVLAGDPAQRLHGIGITRESVGPRIWRTLGGDGPTHSDVTDMDLGDDSCAAADLCDK
jgi:hypothetical protein